MEQVRDLNNILLFTPTRKIIYKDVGYPKFRFMIGHYLYTPTNDSYVKLRRDADEAWEKGDKELSTQLHAQANQKLKEVPYGDE